MTSTEPLVSKTRIWPFIRRTIVYCSAMAGCSLLIIATPILIFVILQWSKTLPDRMPFDSATWRENKQTDSIFDETYDKGPRIRMIDEIFDRRVLDGKQRDEVVCLLGPPDSDWKWLGTANSLEYYISFTGNDHEVCLIVEFGDDDHVFDYYTTYQVGVRLDQRRESMPAKK